MAENEIQTSIGFDVDAASVGNVKRAAEDVRRAVDGVGQPLGDLGAKARVGVTGVETSFKSLRGLLVDQQNDVEDLRREWERYNDTLDESARKQQQAGDYSSRFNQVSQNVSAFGDADSALVATAGLLNAGGLSGAAGAATVGADLLATAEALPRLSEAARGIPSAIGAAVSAIGVGGLGLIGAVGALALIMADLEARFEEAKDAARRYINAQLEAGQLVAQGGTTRDLEKLIEDRTAQRDFQESVLAQYQGFVDEFDALNEAMNTGELSLADLAEKSFGQRQREIEARLSDATGGQITSIRALIPVLEEYRAEIDSLNNDINAASSLLGSTQIQMNDANARATEEAQKQIAMLDARTRQEEMLNELIRSGSIPQVDNLIAANEDQIAILRQRAQELSTLAGAEAFGSEARKLYVEQLAKTQEQIATLTNVNYELENSVKAAIDATRGLSGQLSSEFRRELAEGVKDAAIEGARAIQEYEDRRADIIAQGADQIAQLEADGLKKRLDALERFNESEAARRRDFLKRQEQDAKALERDLAKQDKQAADQLAKTNQQYFQQERRALEDHQTALRQIQLDSADQLDTALASGSRSGAIAAIRQAERATARENEEFQRQANRRKEDYDLQLADLRASLTEQRQEALDRYRERLDDQRAQFEAERQERLAAFQREQQQLQEELRQRKDAITQAQTEQLQQLKTAYASQLAAAQQAGSQRISLAKTAEQAVVESEKKIRDARIATARQTVGFGGRAIPAYAQGGLAPAGRDILVGERGPELIRLPSPGMVYPNNRLSSLGGNTSIVVNVEAMPGPGMDTAAFAELTAQIAVDKVTEAVRRASRG